MAIFKEGSTGEEVKRIQQALKDQGFDPGIIDGDFGPGTEAAVMAFQRSEGLASDGVVGIQTMKALGLVGVTAVETFETSTVNVNTVAKMFPHTPLGNIKTHLPFVLDALVAQGLGDKQMILMALGTIRAETESFEPISEFKSRFNTSPNGHPFDLYDKRKDLGNRGAPDGSSFKGRGFVQLTGRANYTKFGAEIGQDLVNHPELANDPKIAAELLARFLKNQEDRIRRCLANHDLRCARRAVNGGSHGLDAFSDAYEIGNRLLG